MAETETSPAFVEDPDTAQQSARSPLVARKAVRGRGAVSNPRNRFEKLTYEPNPDAPPDERPLPRTEFLADASVSILSTNDSPDLPFHASLNPYRGCEHGCAYCYARPTHEFLGFSAGIDFESRIMVKTRAAELLRAELSAHSWKPQLVALSGVTDCYQPAERSFKITRACLEVFLDFRNPVGIITKNALVLRDLDLLKALCEFHAVGVWVSITTLDPALARDMEPRTSSPSMRLDAIRTLAAAGIPVGVMLAPVIPALNEPEIPAILDAAADAGAKFSTYTLLRMPHGVKDIFAEWLETHLPLKAPTVLSRIRAMRGGRLNDPDFGARFQGEGIFAEQIRNMFLVCSQRAGLNRTKMELSTAHFRRPGEAEQLPLFEY